MTDTNTLDCLITWIKKERMRPVTLTVPYGNPATLSLFDAGLLVEEIDRLRAERRVEVQN